MKRVFKIVLLAITLLMCFAIKAQQNGLGPHGGRLKTVGSYKIELLGCDNYLEVYLYDRDTNSVNNNNITGNVEFYYANQATLNIAMVRYGMDGFTAKIPVNTFSYSKVTFDINSEYIITERFENECLINSTKN